jgi:hypothetical protein
MPTLVKDAPKTIKRPLKREKYKMNACLSEPLWALLNIWGYSKSDINAKTGVHNSYLTWIWQGKKPPAVHHEEKFISMLLATIEQASKLKLKSPYAKLNTAKIMASKVIIKNHSNKPIL